MVLADDSVDEGWNFHSAIEGKYAVLFFYPLDFTFVCPTELIAMDNRMDQFNDLGAVVVGVSIDSHWTHKPGATPLLMLAVLDRFEYTLAADMIITPSAKPMA